MSSAHGGSTRPRHSDASGTTTPSSSPPANRSGRHANERRKEAAAGRIKKDEDPPFIGPWRIGKTIGKGSSGELGSWMTGPTLGPRGGLRGGLILGGRFG